MLPDRPAPPAPLLTATLLALAFVLAWDAGGGDLPLARLLGGAHGFALRDDAWLASGLHDGGRWLSWLAELALCVGVWFPFGPLRRIGIARRFELAAGVLAAGGAVSLLKAWSQTSCPWDLAAFGGVARYASHWSLGPDGGPGRCFPAGHAAAGFAFLGGYFAFRGDAPRVARRWLAASLAAGFLFGFGQQLRGAHFLSHTLWTGWICWVVAWAIDGLVALRARRTEQQP